MLRRIHMHTVTSSTGDEHGRIQEVKHTTAKKFVVGNEQTQTDVEARANKMSHVHTYD